MKHMKKFLASLLCLTLLLSVSATVLWADEPVPEEEADVITETDSVAEADPVPETDPAAETNIILETDPVTDIDSLIEDEADTDAIAEPGLLTDGSESCEDGHLPGEPVQENYVEPTATEDGGYDMVVYCQRCGEELNREHTVLESEDTGEPILVENLRIYTSLTIGIEVYATFSVRKPDVQNFDHWYIEVSKLNEDLEPISTKRFGEGQEGAISSDYVYNAKYTDVTAKEFGVVFSVSLHAFDADGQEYVSPSNEFTMREYIISELLRTSNSDARRILAADLLNYAAAAQIYFGYDTENLVNENLSAEAQAAMEQFADTGEASAALVNGVNGPNVYSSLSIKNRIVLSLTVRGIGSPGEVKIRIQDHETGTVKATVTATKRGSVWVAEYAGFEAEDMRTMFDFIPLADGVETGTPLSWSVEGYARAARQNPNASAAELNLFNTLLHYTDAVYAAFGD